MKKIIPRSPNPNVRVQKDQELARIGDVNYVIKNLSNLPTYVNNAGATAAGLSPGDFYRLSDGHVMVVYIT